MRKVSGATAAIILAIALYFMLSWGFDALRTLSAPNFGLEEVWRSQYIFVIGRLLGLDPIGLLKLAAFFGAIKLAVAGVCGLHIVDRLRCLYGGTPNTELLEGALILVVAISIVSSGPAVWSNNAELVREQAAQLALAALATALCMLERSHGRAAGEAEKTVDPVPKAGLPRDATWFTPWR